MLLKLHKYLLFYNFFISLCAVALTKYFAIIFKSNLPIQYYTFIYFGTLAAYNFLRHYKTLGDFFSRRKTLHFYLIISGLLISSGLYLFFPLKMKLYFIPLTILVLLYNFPFTNVKSLRTVAFVKIFLIALVWVFTCCCVLFFSEEINIYKTSAFITAQLFFLVAITLPFDIYDSNSDKFKTLPNTIGIKNSLLLSKFCIAIYIGIILFTNVSLSLKLAHVLFCAIAFYVIHLQKNRQKLYRLYYFVDGLMILQMLFVGVVFWF